MQTVAACKPAGEEEKIERGEERRREIGRQEEETTEEEGGERRLFWRNSSDVKMNVSLSPPLLNTLPLQRR